MVLCCFMGPNHKKHQIAGILAGFLMGLWGMEFFSQFFMLVAAYVFIDGWISLCAGAAMVGMSSSFAEAAMVGTSTVGSRGGYGRGIVLRVFIPLP